MKKAILSQEIVSERFTKLFALMVMVISFLSLMGWYISLMFLSKISFYEVPMAPSTAYVFIVLVLGLWFYLRPQKKAINRNVALVSGLIVIGLSSIFVIAYIYNYYIELEHAFAKIPTTRLSIPLGHMSLVTAIMFVVSGLAFLFLLSQRKLVRAISIVFTLILFITSLTLALAYVFGTPLFYFDSFIPPAFFTALSFLLVSLALMAASDKNSFLLRKIWANSTNARLLRGFLPVIMIVSIVKSIITIRILPLFDFHPAIGVLIVSVILIAVFVVVILLISKKIGVSLDTALSTLNTDEGKYRTMIETSNDLIWILDKNGNFTFLNGHTEKATGYALRNFMGKSFIPLVLEDELPFLNKVFEKTMSGETVSYEMSLKTVYDHTIILAVNTAPLYTNGEVQAMFSFGRDITQRKEAERLLKVSEKRFKALHNASFGGIAIHDLGIIKDCNQGLSDITGYSFDELIGMDGLLCIAESSRAIVKENIITSHEKAYEVVGLRKNGEEFPLRLEGKMIPHEGKDMRVVEFRDITERIKAENNIRRLSTAVNQSPSVIVITDTKGNLEYVNPKFTEITGYSSAEAIGKASNILKSGEQDASFYKEMWKTVASGEIWRGQFHNKKKNGDLFWEAASISAIYDESGHVINYIKIGEDITELKQAEVDLRQSTQLLEVSQAIAKVGGWELDLNTKVLFWTAETYRIHDTSPEEYIPTFDSGVEFYLPESHSIISEALKAAIDNGVGFDKVLGVLTAKGRRIDVRVTCEILFQDGRPAKLTGIFQDITQQKKAESKLQKALGKALESDQLKSAFLANMSHEIRTPMNGIMGFLNLLNQPDLGKSEIDQYSAIMNKSSDRLLNTINDIIDISKIEAGEMSVSKTETSINNIVDEVYAFHSPEADEKGLSLILQATKPTEEINIITDSHKLHGILTNLIKNAIKYTERGYVKFGYQIKGEFIEFSVEDSGIGIPENRIKAIFNRFEQADIGDTRVYEGSGLGLAISNAYADMLGGDIRVESIKGQGSKFTCKIPYIQKSEQAADLSSESIKNDPSIINEKKLLVVEDDDISQDLLKAMLKGVIKDITFVSSGADAIELFKNKREFDLILMDLKLPGISGYETTEHIRKFNQDVVIIAQTAFALANDQDKAMQAGCNDYLAKPISQKLLLEMLNKYLIKPV